MTGRDAAKELAARLLCVTGIPALARRRMQGRLAILMFHGVVANPLSPPCPYVIDAKTLRRQMEFVQRHFNVLPLGEALDRLSTATLPDRAVALTFDDGTRNLSTQAAPILRDLGLPAAVFLATGPMGTRDALWPDRLWLAFAHTTRREIDLTSIGLGPRPLRRSKERSAAGEAAVTSLKKLPDAERIASIDSLVATLGCGLDADAGPFELLSWNDARALASDGLVTLHPHSVTHPILSRCSDQKVDREISESCGAVERETGQAPTIFAYPNGHVEDFDERAKAALCRNGIRWALATTKGFAHNDSDPLALPRIGIGSNHSYSHFRLNVSGALPLRELMPWR